jgi:hypothetical protein
MRRVSGRICTITLRKALTRHVIRAWRRARVFHQPHGYDYAPLAPSALGRVPLPSRWTGSGGPRILAPGGLQGIS